MSESNSITKADFGKLLKEKRMSGDKSKRKTQSECAKACGVCLEAYQKWERGLSYPKPERLKLLCKFLDIKDVTPSMLKAKGKVDD